MYFMSEKFLHYIWQNKLFFSHNLYSADGEKLEIIDVGKNNTDAGSDFFNAKIKIADKLWAGNVEIHLRSSDWRKHKHNKDKAYDSVILHVVAEVDEEVFRCTGEKIPQLQLLYPSSLEQNYNELLQASSIIPCKEKIKNVPAIFINSYLSA